MQGKGETPACTWRDGEGTECGTITFVVPGKPRGKQPAVKVNGRYYTPPETRAYANEVSIAAYMARRKHKVKKLKNKALRIDILACFAIPKSVIDRKVEDPHLFDPDVDNVYYATLGGLIPGTIGPYSISKAILDGLQGTDRTPGIIDNDNCVHELHVRKMWARQDEVIVTINWKE